MDFMTAAENLPGSLPEIAREQPFEDVGQSRLNLCEAKRAFRLEVSETMVFTCKTLSGRIGDIAKTARSISDSRNLSTMEW